MDGAELSLREAWQQNAADWIRWSRSPSLDHAFWRMNLPALLSLLPAPHGPTLDLACGEGRVARALKERGYQVTGIDGSELLAAAAREADPEFEVHVADAARIPFEDDRFELVVASLSLMNMDDLQGVLAEVSRLLVPGGHLCMSVPHPVNTWGDIDERRYFEIVRYANQVESGGARVTLHDTHRSLQSYFDALADAGLLIERVLEPAPEDSYVAAVPKIAFWRDRPSFLHVRAVLPGPGQSAGPSALEP